MCKSTLVRDMLKMRVGVGRDTFLGISSLGLALHHSRNVQHSHVTRIANSAPLDAQGGHWWRRGDINPGTVTYEKNDLVQDATVCCAFYASILRWITVEMNNAAMSLTPKMAPLRCSGRWGGGHRWRRRQINSGPLHMNKMSWCRTRYISGHFKHRLCAASSSK